MAIGAAYFGNRIPRHVAEDMSDLAERGFTGVLHTFSENDLAYYPGTIRRIVEISREAGLEVQLSPWGVGGIFGGEAETAFTARHPEAAQVLSTGRPLAAACPNQPAFRDFVRGWAEAAVATGAERVFWDEPHWPPPARYGAPSEAWTCRCDLCRRGFEERYEKPMPQEQTTEVEEFRRSSLVGFLAEMLGHVAGRDGRSTVCLVPPTGTGDPPPDWDEVAGLEGLDTLATDPYWARFGQPVDPWVGHWSRAARRLAERSGARGQVWIQAFGIGPERADEVRAAVRAAREAGVDDLWAWGYEACGHMDGLGTRDPDRVWAVVTEALTGMWER
jgi:hypothetical protein